MVLPKENYYENEKKEDWQLTTGYRSMVVELDGITNKQAARQPSHRKTPAEMQSSN